MPELMRTFNARAMLLGPLSVAVAVLIWHQVGMPGIWCLLAGYALMCLAFWVANGE